MSRQYMNERWCVRCGRMDGTPYLKKHWNKLVYPYVPITSLQTVLDIGCGNGRNSEFMKEQGFTNIISLDMAGDYGSKCVFDESPLPLFVNSVEIILANYSLMFLSRKERKRVIKDIKKAAKFGAHIMVELYPAKDSYCKTEEDMVAFQQEIFDDIGWKKVLYSKGHFIAENEPA